MPGNLFVNGKILHKAGHGLQGQPTFADCMLVRDGLVTYIGDRDAHVLSETVSDDETTVHDLQGRTVLPGFIDGHMHLLVLGQSLQKLGLEHCKSLADIRSTIKSYATSNPDVPRILCKGWMHSMTDGQALASMVDDIDPRPIFIDSKDLHFTWCNTAALRELKVADMADPAGGKIDRDTDGKPLGLLSESAILTIVWPHLAGVASQADRLGSIRAAIDSYNAVGYTGLVDMAMDEAAWDALCALYDETPDLPMRIAAYWIIKPSASESDVLVQVDRAITLHSRFNATTTPNLQIVGIKVICDGIVDACTAYMAEPYSTRAPSADPLWTAQQLLPVVRKADGAGLQVALHAIGDAAITMAVDVLATSGTPGRRHRIEHLELASPEDARRLGELGITASIQPVHADPGILRAWPKLLGQHRCARAFPYREFADGGAVLALGSDAPTAPWAPLRNAYVATTRRSAREPDFEEVVNENFKLGLCETIAAASAGSAISVFADERTGSLEVGKCADFVVFDMEWDVTQLLNTQIRETWFGGKRVWKLSP